MLTWLFPNRMPFVTETTISRDFSEISCLNAYTLSILVQGKGCHGCSCLRCWGSEIDPLKYGALPCRPQKAAPKSLWPSPCPSSPWLLSPQKPTEGLFLKFPNLPNDRICRRAVQLSSIFLRKCHQPRRFNLYLRGRDWKSNITPRNVIPRHCLFSRLIHFTKTPLAPLKISYSSLSSLSPTKRAFKLQLFSPPLHFIFCVAWTYAH